MCANKARLLRYGCPRLLRREQGPALDTRVLPACHRDLQLLVLLVVDEGEVETGQNVEAHSARSTSIDYRTPRNRWPFGPTIGIKSRVVVRRRPARPQVVDVLVDSWQDKWFTVVATTAATQAVSGARAA